jgi:hypothetical protein
MKSTWKNMGTNLGWNAKIDDTMVVDTMVVDSIIITTCISFFPKPLLDFDSMPKKFTLTNMHFYKSCSCISI